MSDCKATNLSMEELRNAVNTRRLMHTPRPDQTADETAAYFDFMQSAVRVEETTHEYQYTDSGERIVDKSVTDLNREAFIKQKGKLEAERISNLPDNKLKSVTGTHVHKTLQNLFLLKIKKQGSFEDARIAATTGDTPMTGAAFTALVEYVNKFVAQVNADQAKIDKDGKARMWVELPSIDPLEATGASMDLVVLFSDNTAKHYDFKTMVPSIGDFVGSGENARLVSDLVRAYKISGYNTQMNEYKKHLLKIAGVKAVRESRIIPIHMQLALKNRELRSTGDNLLPRIVKLELGDDNEFLQQIPVAGELTGIASLDDLIQSQTIIINKLSERLSKRGLSPETKRELKDRISKLSKATNNVLVKRDFRQMFISIRETLWLVKNNLDQPLLNEDGTPNPRHLSDEQLKDYRDELNVYSRLVEFMGDYMEDYEKEVNAADYKAMVKNVVETAGHASGMLQKVESRLNDRILEIIDDPDAIQNGRLKPQQKLTWMNKVFSRLSEIDNPIFQAFRKMKDDAFHKVRVDMNKARETILEKQKALFQWARANGMSNEQAYMRLINRNTGNFHSKFKKEFYDLREKAIQEQDSAWVKSVYEFRDIEEYKEKYKAQKGRYEEYLKGQLNNLKDLVIGDTVEKTAEQYRKEFNYYMAKWEISNNLLENDEAWLNEYNFHYLKIKADKQEEFKTEEFKYIEANQPLHDFYSMVEDYNYQWRNIFGMSAKDLPHNFFANIRKDAIDRLLQGNVSIGDSMAEIINSFKLREEEVYIKQQDENTGEIRHAIPIPFFNYLKDANGNFTLSEKSFDVGNVMIQFAKVAYNHKYMSEIEARTLALKDYIGNETYYKELSKTSRGDTQKGPRGEDATTKTGTASEAYKLFSRFVDYYIYGVNYDEKGLTSESGFNSTKALLITKNFLSAKILGFAVIPAVAAYIQGRTGLRFMASKGIAFSHDQLNKAIKLQAKEAVKAKAAGDFFDVYAEDYTIRMAEQLSMKNANKLFSMRTLFATLRYADENSDKTLVVAMMQNYGLDEQGNLKRLKLLPEGTKSLWDRATVDENKGFKIEGMTDQAFVAFRNSVREISQGIKGTMSHEDVSLVQMNLWLNLLMQFKTWMPGVLKERFGSLRHNEILQTAEFGRIRAYLTEYEKLDGVAMLDFITQTALPKIGKLIMALSPVGLMTDSFNRMDEKQSRDYYVKWASKNPDQAKKITEEMFLEAKQAQINAMIAEVRAIMIFLSLILLMSIKGDDDKRLYTKTWITRNLMKFLQRAESELAFAYSPREFVNLLKNPLPTTRLLSDVSKTLRNSGDELRDTLFGENSPQDKTPWGYYGSQWIPGVQQLRRVIEIYEQDERLIKY